MGRRSTVVKLDDGAGAFADAINQVQAELGRADLIVHCDAVLNA